MQQVSMREALEQAEKERLSEYACCAQDSAGRDTQEDPCPLRTCFQRDRDRIVHCKAFRRLMHKTQVFLSPEGDHYRTRLTHTLEVSQIARTIARALRLNEDLTEAIALGHDLGHTPFGHAGEFALNEVCQHGFIHSAQSVRVVEVIENGGRGLNLCKEVRDGIRYHSSGTQAETLEGRVVRYADKIAYMNHDIEDAVRAGVLTQDDIPGEIKQALGHTKSQRINTMICSLVRNSSDDIRMDEPVQKAYDGLRRFMFQAVYHNKPTIKEEDKAMRLVKSLFSYFVEHPDKLPGEFVEINEREGAHRAACDYISGMSDRYAVRVYEKLFVPKAFIDKRSLYEDF